MNATTYSGASCHSFVLVSKKLNCLRLHGTEVVNKSSNFFCIKDDSNLINFLVDTGAQVSFIQFKNVKVLLEKNSPLLFDMEEPLLILLVLLIFLPLFTSFPNPKEAGECVATIVN
uniref:Uncharacterized protein n=1 Tax=Lepeophtheirus salmonis TaxID=72036 RepID=A0A0K2T6R5_LEPSM